MVLDTWDEPEDLRYDRMPPSDLTSLAFTDAHHGALILGPVGVGNTHLAHVLGHTSIRRLARVDLLILDDFALRPLDAIETNDFSELVVERHRKASTIVTSNREPVEWLTMMSDALLAQSAVDRLTASAHIFILEGPSYRQRTHPDRHAGIDSNSQAHNAQ